MLCEDFVYIMTIIQWEKKVIFEIVAAFQHGLDKANEALLFLLGAK